MNAIPSWMRPQAVPEQPAAAAPQARYRMRGGDIVRRGAYGFARLISEAAGGADPDMCGFARGIDARAKVIGLIGLIVVTTLVSKVWVLGLCCGVCLALAMIFRVPARRLARVWMVVPLFSAAMMLPAALNVVTEGKHIWTLYRFPAGSFGPWPLPKTLAVTDAGLIVFARFVLRATTCVSFALLLTATTEPARLFRGLRALGVPRIFIMLLTMMHRYLCVLAQSAEEIHLAKVSRSISRGSVRQEQKWAAAGIGALFRRTQALGHAVYLAMLSRGYTGEAHLLDEPRRRARDWAFLIAAAALAALILVLEFA